MRREGIPKKRARTPNTTRCTSNKDRRLGEETEGGRAKLK